MKPIQQRRSFFLAATSITALQLQTKRKLCARWKSCFLPCGRIAVILTALLFTSCASLTPERIDQLVAIASQAALVGSQIYLQQHPDHREAVAQVAASISPAKRSAPVSNEKAVELLHSLPLAAWTLRGKDGELYVTDKRLVVWDGKAKKAVPITGNLEAPVLRVVATALKQASAPKPPALSRAALPRSITGVNALRAQPIVNEIHVTNVVIQHFITNTVIREGPAIYMLHDQTNRWQDYTNYHVPFGTSNLYFTPPMMPGVTIPVKQTAPDAHAQNFVLITNSIPVQTTISNWTINADGQFTPVKQIAPYRHAQKFQWITNSDGRRGKLFLPQQEREYQK